MLRLSKKSDYALIALKHMAAKERGVLVPAREIASEYDLPPDLLAKILQKLARSGLVSSRLGAGGGYALSRPPERITLKDIVQSIEGPVRFLACYSAGEKCDLIRKCSIRKNLKGFERSLADLLDTITLADF